VPGHNYRSDAIDRLNNGTRSNSIVADRPRRPATRDMEKDVIRLLAEAGVTGRSYRWEHRGHQYKLQGRQGASRRRATGVRGVGVRLGPPDCWRAQDCRLDRTALVWAWTALMLAKKAFRISRSCAPAIRASARKWWTWRPYRPGRDLPRFRRDLSIAVPESGKPPKIWAIA